MLHSIRRIGAAFIALSALGLGQIAHAQQNYCSSRSSTRDVVCITVASPNYPISGFDQFVAWTEHRDSTSSNNWYRVPASLEILNGSTRIKSGGTVSTQSETWTASFSAADGLAPSPSPYSLTIRDTVSRATVGFTLTINKNIPVLTLSGLPATSRIGQSAHLVVHGEFFKPSIAVPVIVYLRTPGASQVEIGRRTFSGLESSYSIQFDYALDYIFSGASGDYAFQVSYLGDALNEPRQTGVTTVKVGPFATSTTLTSSVTETKQGTNFTLTANVGGALSGWPAPSGVVEFKDGSTVLGTVSLNAQGAAVATARLGTVGTHSLVAHYVGDSNYQGSTSSQTSMAIKFNPAVLVPILDQLLSGPPSH